MSVLRCSRGDCDNIMCDRYSPDYGYICDECFDELVSRGIDTDIAEFMASDVPLGHAPREIDVRNHFDKMFSVRE